MKSASEVWVMDISGSMTGPRYVRMKAESHQMFQQAGAVTCLAFSSGVRKVEAPDQLPEPFGGTDLATALREASQYFPGKVVVWTDGEPDDEDAALKEAANLPGVVSCVYFGDDNNREAKEFVRRLAQDNGGQFVWKDILKNTSLLEQDVRDVLGLPAPIAL